ncbi:MAG TPA: class I SAM-dependent methyltransferase [Candidatus Binataceae bacterium]|jgi:ubiquinone/menaquinone biosynthesis C-methylase UbiE|nr:class I SAM-dependent methyltransferase [Candidatus Binataceae bacterium]
MTTQAESTAPDHKTVVREEFTRQADAYAAAPVITDAERLARLVQAINPHPAARAVEVATGPGYVAMALASRCREVVGLDLTPAPIAIAERISRERGVGNVSFQVGDAERLPFADGAFDIAVCRFAFHHFERPETVLAEMVRVCRNNGTVAIEDLFSSEHLERADYMNRLERLRDHSHTKALTPTGLIAMTRKLGLEIESMYSDRLVVDMENWLEGAQTGQDDACEVRRLVAEDMRRNLSGMLPFEHDGAVKFVQRTVAIVARKL